MCHFFSFVTYKGGKYFFNSYQRADVIEKEFDSHTAICHWAFNSTTKGDLCNKYEYCNGKLIADLVVDTDECLEDVEAWMDHFATTKEFHNICLEAVKRDGMILRYIKEQTLEICAAAVNENPAAWVYVDDKYKEFITPYKDGGGITVVCYDKNGVMIYHQHNIRRSDLPTSFEIATSASHIGAMWGAGCNELPGEMSSPFKITECYRDGPISSTRVAIYKEREYQKCLHV